MDFRGIPNSSLTSINTPAHEDKTREEDPSNEPKLAKEMEAPLRMFIVPPPLPSIPQAQASLRKDPPKALGSRAKMTANPQPAPMQAPPPPPRPVKIFSDQGINVKSTRASDPPSPQKKANQVHVMGNLHQALKPSKSLSKNTPTQTSVEMLQGAGLALVEGYGKSPVKAEKYLDIAERLKSLQSTNGTVTTTMLRLYEIGAEIHELSGNPGKAFEVRAQASQALEFGKTHPLHNMKKAIDFANKGTYGRCGLQIESGSPSVASGVSLQIRPNKDGNARAVADFRLTPFARDEFETRLATIQKNSKAFGESLPKELGSVKIHLNQKDIVQGRDEKGEFTTDVSTEFMLSQGAVTTEIEFKEGQKVIGKVIVGSESGLGVLYQTIKVEVPVDQEKGECLKTMQQMITVLGLGPVMGKQLNEDKQKAELALITNCYFPHVLDQLHEDKAFYTVSAAELKKKIILLVPEKDRPNAVAIFQKYEKNPLLIGRSQILPGKEIPILKDFSEDLKKAGLIGFMAGTADSVGAASICDTGLFSTEFRLRMGLVSKSSTSPVADLRSGGATSTFLRAVTVKTTGEPIPAKEWKMNKKKELILHPKTGEKTLEEMGGKETDRLWQFAGKYQFLVNPEVINGGGHATYGDWYGVTNKADSDYPVYQNRPDLLNFVENAGIAQDKHSTKSWVGKKNQEGVPVDSEGNHQPDVMRGTLNEVCIPGGCVSPKHFRGINCINEEAKTELLNEFAAKGMLKNIKKDNGRIVDGTLIYGGGAAKISINEFIHVGNQFNDRMWGNKG